MATTVLNVPDISCEHCERTITNALQLVPGVRTVSVEKMKDILNEEDYPVVSVV